MDYDWANITVTVYDQDGNLQAPQNRKSEPTSGANVCKGYGFAASSTGREWNANGNCQNTWLLDMAKTDKSMNISGIHAMYTGCSVTLNGSTIPSSFSSGTCSVASRNYNKYNDSLVIRLQKVPPTPTFSPQLQSPTCSKNNWPTAIAAGSSASFSSIGQDPDTTSGTTIPALNFYFTKQQSTSYCSIGTGLATEGKWQQVGSAINALTGAVTLNTSGLPAGTYIMTTNVRDNDNQFSTGNPGAPAGCGYPTNGCQGTFTIGSVPSPTPTRIPTATPPGPTATPPPGTTPSPSPTPPSQPPFSVQVNIWEGNNCSVTTTPVTSTFAATIEAKLNNQPTGTNLPINHTITVLGLIPGRTSTFALKNLPAGWSRATNCSSAIVSRQQFSQGPVNFWVEEAVDPWWQSAAGDIYGYVVYSAIPAISDGFLSLKLGLSDSGAFIFGDKSNVPNDRIRESNPLNKAETELSLKENYAYFDELTRDFEKQIFSGSAYPAFPTKTPNRQATILKTEDNLQLNSSWGSSDKVIVFVEKNLRINKDQTVPLGSYLHFIVGGNITIDKEVGILEGMYSADGNIVIEAGPKRFVSRGSVVSFGSSGIKSLRSLPGVDNNTQSATKFEYRPDLVVNTPRELRSTDSSWTEVAPD